MKPIIQVNWPGARRPFRDAWQLLGPTSNPLDALVLLLRRFPLFRVHHLALHLLHALHELKHHSDRGLLRILTLLMVFSIRDDLFIARPRVRFLC